MRVGLVTGEYPPLVGGVGDHAARLAQELAALEVEAEVLTTATQAAATRSAAGPAARGDVPVLRAIARWDWRILWRIPRLARERGWDVLHVQYQPGMYHLHGAINVLPACLARRQQRPAIVTTFHDLRVPYLFPGAGRLRPAAVSVLARFSDAVIAVDAGDLPVLERWTRRRRPPVLAAHVSLGNQLDAPPPPDFDRDAWRARLGVEPPTVLLGHFGFVNRSKGVDALVRALGRLVAGGVDAQLLMIGEAAGASDPTNRAYLAEVQGLVSALDLSSRVTWTGHVTPERVAGWLRCLDITVLPFADGASLRRTSLIAAWAQGVPVLTTAPRQPTWRADAPPAWTVPAAKPDALAEALAHLIAHPELRGAIARAGQAFAARFSWPAVADQTRAVYEAALKRRDVDVPAPCRPVV